MKALVWKKFRKKPELTRRCFITTIEQKKKLFDAIFNYVMGDFFAEVEEKMYSDAPLDTKIEFFVNSYMTVIMKNPHIPGFLINEINRNPERVIAIFKMTPIARNNMFGRFAQMIQEESEKGTIKPIAPEQLIVNIIALTIFPVVARPILQAIIFKNDPKSFNSFMEGRKHEVTQFIINAIKKD